MFTTLALALALTVIDGDTVKIGGEVIRISGIDTPEIRGRCDAERRLALVAKRRLADLLDDATPIVIRGKRDRYGRTLATIQINGLDVGAILIAEHLARPWRGKREPWCI